MTKLANFSGFGGNVQMPGASLSQALSSFRDTAFNMANQQEAQRAKAVEEQRLADVLAIQQAQMADSRMFNEGKLAQGQDALKLQQEQFANTQAQQAREQFTQQALADIYSQSTPEAQRERLAYYQSQTGGFSPDVRALSDLRQGWEPKSQGSLQADYFYGPNGEAVAIPKGAPIPEGYVANQTIWKELYGKGGGSGGGSGGGIAANQEKEGAAYNKLMRSVANYGGIDTPKAQENISMLQAMGIPASMVEQALARSEGSSWFDKTFSLNDIDKFMPEFKTTNGKQVKLGSFIQEANRNGATVFYDQSTGTLGMSIPDNTMRPIQGDGRQQPQTLASAGQSEVFNEGGTLAQVARESNTVANQALGMETGIPPMQNPVSSTRGLELGQTLEESAKINEDITLQELVNQVKRGVPNSKGTREAKATLREIRERNVNEFDARFKGLSKYLYD